MILTIRRLLPVAVVLSFLMPSTLNARESYPLPDRESCSRTQFHKQARTAFKDNRYTQGERRALRRIVRCANPRSRTVMRFHLRRYKEGHRYRVQLAAVTPYRCGSMRVAIPCYIVACESHFNWGAYNPSGAAGIYQIMPIHGRPFPANTRAARLRHHQIAFNLYRGGAGASHWVCA